MLDERERMFTEREIERQDYVDNAIYYLIQELSPWGTDDVEWDMEYIGEIRDIIKEFLVDKLHLMTEQQFYPYRELEPEEDENIIPEQAEIIVSDKNGVFSEIVDHVIHTLDAQEFADLTGELLGGQCRYIGEYKYSFVPNPLYQGALDDIKEKQNGK